MNISSAGGYIRYINDTGSSERAEKELKRAFEDRDLLLSDNIPTDEGIRAGIMKGLETLYSHPALKGLFTKTSVSELTRAAYEDEEAKPVFETDIRSADVPSFAAAEQKAGGAARGSAYHRMLELLDYTDFNEAQIPEWIKQIIQIHIRADQRNLIHIHLPGRRVGNSEKPPVRPGQIPDLRLRRKSMPIR